MITPDVWIATDSDGSVWRFDSWPRWMGSYWYGCNPTRMFCQFPDIPPGHMQRMKLVPVGEPVKGGE